ncbi:acyl-ACP--UDP-N-acetylglucosamine O-acyltransferase [Alkalilimnicola ehrlichii MLHE-1]|uniref:Acyl-[acyl-carrier-protein]--UDP-N-acetylglucosamine O-acyltransferase n=1 Tax=Alkalilimnicola ehrlichii (strain ATCC BAA-1101 / DSM 17681 / MLHE-1) TaxID=187272 RepID=LPXA_ALKEH|nr:acyl-ACP--UDP-N-acetylglucosamine O-acyltransferase [Alkalilimnicola ehrlichii]Q0A7J1.1 RecName: Full=Acyl-[acyl-carrier-protein]--UDP-N-acetylglucosamine O-acyltransferase; Short=UDP-N-acetylglucosamine acyltransferase [Alkalilimnicola ehrlichii MLHE-1]ABI57196.1 acyl-[acyl-carrier-protein]--UDP-N-acetylglucosamine O-acyltransferase [Alkalilimnicola ehrlichii MLHE-1]
MTRIDPKAVVDPSAELDEGVTVGPFTVIGPDVQVGAGTRVGPHVVINGPTRLGRNNRIHPFASIGDDPQDKKYAGEPTRLEIGDDNVIREYVTLNRGTPEAGGLTRLGDRNWIMAYSHVAHDCRLGNDITFANSASLAGHVDVEDHAILGGFALVHQFCRIGAYAFCGFGSVINRDVLPFTTVSGHMAQPHGINVVGLRRHGMGPERIRELKRAYRLIFKSGKRLDDALEELRLLGKENPDLEHLAAFIAASNRGILR